MAAADGNVRASDAERDRVIEELHRHAADGRLTMNEFEERVGEAYTAVTRADLEPVLRDLPSLPPQAGAWRTERRPPRRRVSDAVDGRMITVAVVLATVAILAVTGAWWMWWIVFPLMGIFGKHRSRGGWCSGRDASGRDAGRRDARRGHGRPAHDSDRETITV